MCTLLCYEVEQALGNGKDQAEDHFGDRHIEDARRIGDDDRLARQRRTLAERALKTRRGPCSTPAVIVCTHRKVGMPSTWRNSSGAITQGTITTRHRTQPRQRHCKGSRTRSSIRTMSHARGSWLCTNAHVRSSSSGTTNSSMTIFIGHLRHLDYNMPESKTNDNPNVLSCPRRHHRALYIVHYGELGLKGEIASRLSAFWCRTSSVRSRFGSRGGAPQL